VVPHGDASPAPLILSERLATFKRLYRWLNLTVIHQGLWPLLLVMTAAPAGPPEQIAMPWYLARIGAPALAAALAVVYLAQRPVTPTAEGDGARESVSTLRGQVRLLLVGLPVMVAAARLVAEPEASVLKLILFGAADVLAFHLIHFGVVARSFPTRDQGQVAAVLLFALSWGLRDALLTGAGAAGGSFALAFASGLVLGLAVALLSSGLRRWPGGFWPAASTHWLVVYLIFGFVE
jgi:hypothetical protein